MPHYWLCTIVQSVYNRWKSGLSQFFGWDPIVTIVPDCTRLWLDFVPSIHVQPETIHDNPLQSWFNPGLYMLSSIVTRLNEFYNQTPIHTIEQQSSDNPKKIKEKEKKNISLRDVQSFNPASIRLQSWLNHLTILFQSSFNQGSTFLYRSIQSRDNPAKSGGTKKKSDCMQLDLQSSDNPAPIQSRCTGGTGVHKVHRGVQ